MRSNLCTNPQCNDTAQWQPNNLLGTKDNGTVAVSTTYFLPGLSNSILCTWPTTSRGSAVVFAVPTVSGTQYTARLWVYVPSGSPDVHAEVAFLVQGTPTSVKDQVVSITVTWTANGNTAYVGPVVNSATSGNQCYLLGCVIEQGATAGPDYFDGNTIDCVWTGTAGASTTLKHSLDATRSRRNLAVNPSWRNASTTLIEVRRNIASGIAPVALGAATVTPNVSYNGQLWYRVSIGTTTTVGTRLNVNLSDLVNGSTYTGSWEVANDGASPVGIETDWCDSASPTTATVQPGQIIRLGNTASKATYDSTFRFLDFTLTTASSSLLIRNPMVELADVILPYFDGDSLPFDNLTPSWVGTAGASNSVVKGPVPVNPPFAYYASTPENIGWVVDSTNGVYRCLPKKAIGVGGLLAYNSTASSPPGMAWKTQVQARLVGSAVDVAIRPRLFAYATSAIQMVSQPTGTAEVTIPASGAWTDVLLPPSALTPATTATVRWLIYAGTGGIPAGTVIEFRRCCLEVATGLTDTVIGPAFDGSTAGAIWDGTADASTSQALSLASPIPTMPLIGVKVWTNENPPSSPAATTTKPLVLGDRALSLKTQRGRQYELDQDQAGTGEVVVVNDDGGVTGDVASGRIPMRQYVLEATWDGTTYPIFTGYVSAWPDEQQDPATGRATISGVDLFEALAQRELDSVVQETIEAVSVGPPDFYYRLSDDATATGGGNAGTITGVSYPTAPLVDFKLGTASLAFGATSFLNNSSETCLGYSNTTANRARQMQISGPQNLGGPSLDTTQPWLVSVFLDATAGNSSVFNILDPQGNLFGYISFDTTVSGGTVTVYAGGNGYTWGGLNGYLDSSKTGGGMQVAVGYDGTHGIGYLLGGNKVTWTYTAKGTLSWIAAGPAFNSSVIFGSSQGTFRIAHLAIWTGTIPVAQDMSDVSYAGYWSWNADAPESRIVRLLKWAGHTAITYETDDLALANLPDTKGSSALDVIRESALSTLSRFFMGKDGTARLWYRHHGQTFTPKWVFGGNTAAGELPYEGSPHWDFDTAHIYNDVEVSRHGGAKQRAIDAASTGAYFQRPLQVETTLYYDSSAQQMAQWLAGQYGDPVQRIAALTLHPVAYPALWPAVLGMELGDIVQVNHPSLSGTRSALYQVSLIEHEANSDSGDWVTTLQLTPFSQEWVLAAMHTTLTAFAAAGATSISLAPLPDSATNPAEASLAVGTTIMLDPSTPYQETVTITSVASAPTPNTTGYTSITVGVTATAHAHAAGSVACDPLPSGETDPTAWDSRSVLESTTILSF